LTTLYCSVQFVMPGSRLILPTGHTGFATVFKLVPLAHVLVAPFFFYYNMGLINAC